MSTTTTGGWLGTEPFLNIDAGATSECVGELLHHCLASSQAGVPHPEQHEWKLVGSQRYLAAGVKNWSEFMIGTKAVSIDQSEDELVVTPYRKVHKGFAPMSDHKILVPPSGSNVDLGAAVLQAFELAN